MQKIIEKLKSPRTRHLLKIQSVVIRTITEFMAEKEILTAMPVILAPFTDPLNHEVYQAEIEYMDQRLKLTKSMILHKIMILLGEGIRGVYIISPNVRLEGKDSGSSGRHLIEFSQVDIEIKGATKKEFMRLIEDLYVRVFDAVKEECRTELLFFKRDLPELKSPFQVYESKELEKKFGKEWEREASSRELLPFWVLDHTREFYDKESSERKGYYHNYDLIYPEGIGEALSGGEREYEYKDIIRKMKERKMDPSPYRPYLKLAEHGMLPKTAGGGFGVERLMRYIIGAKHIEDATLFPRVPGKSIVV